MDSITIYKSHKLGLEVHKVFYRKTLVGEFMSLELARTFAMRLAYKIQRGLA